MIAASMARCLHMYASGFQCIAENLEPTEFCESHQKVIEFERLEDSIARKVAIRLVALILLLILFVIPLFYTLQDWYLGPPIEAQEVW